MDIEGFNKIITEYENSIKLLIEKLVKGDEYISKYLGELKDEINSKRERKLAIINQPKMVNHILISLTKIIQKNLFHRLRL